MLHSTINFKNKEKGYNVEMIDEHYKNFKVRDYMDEESLKSYLSTNIIDCSLGTNPFIHESMIKKYILECSSEINKYPSLEYELLKEELLKFWKEHLYNDINTKNIAFGAGTMGILRNISEFLIQEGTKVLGIAPQFPRFISEVELKKGIYEYYNLEKNNNYKFIATDFMKKINNSYSLISIENPNNPTGQIIDVSDIEKIVKKAKQYNIMVIVDEAYGDYMQLNNSAIKLVGKYDNIMVLRSASKFYGLPNHRVGYMFADRELIKIYNEIAIPFPFSDLSASIFIKVLKNYDKLEYTKLKTVEINQAIYKTLKKENYISTNVETPIFTIKTDKHANLTSKLMEEGIIAENCSYFINLDNTYARIRITKDYEQLIKIFSQIL